MNKILIVVDMQNDFIDGALGTPQAVGITPKVIEKIKEYQSRGDMVLYTKDTHQNDYLSTQEGRNLPVPHCILETTGWQFPQDIDQLTHDRQSKIFHKDTFGSSELIDYLVAQNDSRPIDEIELVGLCTDICVISNALAIKAFLPEATLRVDAACCAGVTPESHLNALRAMEMCQIIISSAD